jgi:autotransporter-associated beta strand protein
MRSIDGRGHKSGNQARLMRALLAGTALSAFATLPAAAQNATWLATPGTNDYNTAANWTGATVPGATGTATFDTSTKTFLTVSADTTVAKWVFAGTAPDYAFAIGATKTLNFASAGPASGITITGSGHVTIFNDHILNFTGNTGSGGAKIVTTNGAQTVFATGGGSSGGFGSHFDTQTGGTFDISQVTSPGFVVGSIEGAGDYFIGSRLFAVGSDNSSTTVTGRILDGGVLPGTTGGSLSKTGTGTLTLSGVNTYTGTTTVSQGTLRIDAGGSIALSQQTVVHPDAALIVNGLASDTNIGGTLSGTGTVGFSRIAGGATFAPGSGVAGTHMIVSNSLQFLSGAGYLVQISPTAASSANVTGQADLAGTVRAQFAPGSYVARTYNILSTTTGFNGSTFDGLTTNGLPAGFTSHLSYLNNHDVILNLDAVLGIPTGPSGVGAGALNRNQLTVANTINGFFNNGGTLPPGFLNLFGLTGATLANALTQVSGETATGSQQTTYNAMSQFMGVMTDPFIDGRGGSASIGGATSFAEESGDRARDANAMYSKAPLAQIYDSRWSVWAAGFGGSQTTDGNASVGSNSATSRVFGTAVGADYRFSPYTIAGFALAGGGTNFSVANGGNGRSDLFQAGAFFKHNAGAAYLTGALAYGWQDITTERTLAVAGIDRLRAAFNANAWSGRLESGYRLVTPWFGGIGITPYAAGQFTTFDLPAYAESVLSGANTFALAYGSKSVTDTRSELGLRTDKSFAMQNAILTLRGRAAWAHDFNPDRAVAATFQTLPGASFIVNGAGQASNSVLTTASAEMKWLNGWSAAATFEGEFSEVTRSYAGKGVVRYAW